MYVVTLRSHARRAFNKLRDSEQDEIIEALERLAKDPFSSPNVKRIKGPAEPGYRLRVGRYRVLYILITKDHEIDVADIFLKTGEQDYRQRL